MSQYSRREVLKLGALLAAGLGLDSTYSVVFGDGLQKLSTGEAKVLWLQGMSCTGCSISLLNSTEPGAAEIVTNMISLVYHSTLSAAQGADAMRVIDRTIASNDFILVLEGIHSRRNARGMHDGRPHVGSHSRAGAPQRQGNRGRRHLRLVWRHSGRRGEPDRRGRFEDFHGTEGHHLPEPSGQLPELPGPSREHLGHLGLRCLEGLPGGQSATPDAHHVLRPFGSQQCPRYHYWEKEIFAKHFGDRSACKLGCLGPLEPYPLPAATVERRRQLVHSRTAPASVARASTLPENATSPSTAKARRLTR